MNGQPGVLLYSPLHPHEGRSTCGVWVLFEGPPTGHRRKGPAALVEGTLVGVQASVTGQEQGQETEPGSPCHVPWEKREQSSHPVLWPGCVCSTRPSALGRPGGWSSWLPQQGLLWSGSSLACVGCDVGEE